MALRFCFPYLQVALLVDFKKVHVPTTATVITVRFRQNPQMSGDISGQTVVL